MIRWILLASVSAAGMLHAEEFLQWDAKQAKAVALASRVTGQIGKTFDTRILSTDRSYNFKLRATWLTPEAIKAHARLEQIGKALSDRQTTDLVSAAREIGAPPGIPGFEIGA